MSYKNSVKMAIDNYLSKQTATTSPSRKNKSPEKSVVKAIIQHAQSLHLHLHVVESKSVYNQKAGRYISQQAESGFPDIVGNTSDGIGVFIEVKAPGRRSTLKEHQRQFLLSKIATNCFACCIDSPDSLASLYHTWLSAENKQAVLLKALPKITEPKVQNLFD